MSANWQCPPLAIDIRLIVAGRRRQLPEIFQRTTTTRRVRTGDDSAEAVGRQPAVLITGGVSSAAVNSM